MNSKSGNTSMASGYSWAGVEPQHQPEQLANIGSPDPHDVLCGRGGSTNRHVGNANFRDLVNSNKGLYVTLTKRQKMMVARSIVQAIRSQAPPGRFLQKDPVTSCWFDIGRPRALEKTSQALREKPSSSSSSSTVSSESTSGKKKRGSPSPPPTSSSIVSSESSSPDRNSVQQASPKHLHPPQERDHPSPEMNVEEQNPPLITIPSHLQMSLPQGQKIYLGESSAHRSPSSRHGSCPQSPTQSFPHYPAHRPAGNPLRPHYQLPIDHRPSHPIHHSYIKNRQGADFPRGDDATGLHNIRSGYHEHPEHNIQQGHIQFPPNFNPSQRYSSNRPVHHHPSTHYQRYPRPEPRQLQTHEPQHTVSSSWSDSTKRQSQFDSYQPNKRRFAYVSDSDETLYRVDPHDHVNRLCMDQQVVSNIQSFIPRADSIDRHEVSSCAGMNVLQNKKGIEKINDEQTFVSRSSSFGSNETSNHPEPSTKNSSCNLSGLATLSQAALLVEDH